MSGLDIANLKSTDVVVVRTINSVYTITDVKAETIQAQIEGGVFGTGRSLGIRLLGISDLDSVGVILPRIEIGRRLIVARDDDGLFLGARIIVLPATTSIAINGEPVGG